MLPSVFGNRLHDPIDRQIDRQTGKYSPIADQSITPRPNNILPSLIRNKVGKRGNVVSIYKKLVSMSRILFIPDSPNVRLHR